MSLSPSPDPKKNGPDTQGDTSVKLKKTSANPSEDPSEIPPPRTIHLEVEQFLEQCKNEDPSIFSPPPEDKDFNKDEKIDTLEKFKEKIFFPRAEKIVRTTHHTFLEQNKTKRTNLLTHTSAFLIYFCRCFIVNSLFAYFKIVFE